MKRLQWTIGITSLIFIMAACKKEAAVSNTGIDCDKFKQGVISNDGEMIIKAVSTASIVYSRESIEKLVAELPGNCGITASLSCFDCIDTNPAMTEIQVSFTAGALPVQKTIDLSHSASDNTMKVMNVHD